MTWKALLGAMVGLVLMAGPAQAGDVCPPGDSGKIDVGGEQTSVTVTAPEGFLISGYCVKAGSEQSGAGVEFVTVDPPQESVTITHSSGKAVSHYSLTFVPVLSPSPSPSPSPTPTETPSPTPTPSESPTPSPTPSESPSPTPTESESPTPETSVIPPKTIERGGGSGGGGSQGEGRPLAYTGIDDILAWSIAALILGVAGWVLVRIGKRRGRA